jgi:hypothetical protein
MVIACICCCLQAKAVYVNLKQTDFVVPLMGHVAGDLVGVPTETRYELQALLRRSETCTGADEGILLAFARKLAASSFSLS